MKHLALTTSLVAAVFWQSAASAAQLQKANGSPLSGNSVYLANTGCDAARAEQEFCALITLPDGTPRRLFLVDDNGSLFKEGKDGDPNRELKIRVQLDSVPDAIGGFLLSTPLNARTEVCHGNHYDGTNPLGALSFHTNGSGNIASKFGIRIKFCRDKPSDLRKEVLIAGEGEADKQEAFIALRNMRRSHRARFVVPADIGELQDDGRPKTEITLLVHRKDCITSAGKARLGNMAGEVSDLRVCKEAGANPNDPSSSKNLNANGGDANEDPATTLVVDNHRSTFQYGSDPRNGRLCTKQVIVDGEVLELGNHTAIVQRDIAAGKDYPQAPVCQKPKPIEFEFVYRSGEPFDQERQIVKFAQMPESQFNFSSQRVRIEEPEWIRKLGAVSAGSIEIVEPSNSFEFPRHRVSLVKKTSSETDPIVRFEAIVEHLVVKSERIKFRVPDDSVYYKSCPYRLIQGDGRFSTFGRLGYEPSRSADGKSSEAFLELNKNSDGGLIKLAANAPPIQLHLLSDDADSQGCENTIELKKEELISATNQTGTAQKVVYQLEDKALISPRMVIAYTYDSQLDQLLQRHQREDYRWHALALKDNVAESLDLPNAELIYFMTTSASTDIPHQLVSGRPGTLLPFTNETLLAFQEDAAGGAPLTLRQVIENVETALRRQLGAENWKKYPISLVVIGRFSIDVRDCTDSSRTVSTVTGRAEPAIVVFNYLSSNAGQARPAECIVQLGRRTVRTINVDFKNELRNTLSPEQRRTYLGSLIEKTADMGAQRLQN